MISVRTFSYASILYLAIASGVNAQTPKDRQSPSRPGNVPVFSPVMKSASDARSREFNTNFLPGVKKIAEENLGEGKQLARYDMLQLESSKLILKQQTDQPIRVYYITGISGCQNTLGFSYNLAGATKAGAPYLIFPTTANLTYHSPNSVYLTEGDFVDIENGGNGWQLDFFMIVNGGVGQSDWWWWNTSKRNRDALQHIVTFAIPDSPFLMLGFDDAPGGGDRDFNDLVIVVDVGKENTGLFIDDIALPN